MPAPEPRLPSRTDLPPAAGALLQFLSSARDTLARRIMQESPGMAEPDLNAAISAALTRLLFLAAGERSWFVPVGTLSLLAESDGICRRMGRACSDAGFSDSMVEPAPSGKDAGPGIPDDAISDLLRKSAAETFPAPLAVVPPEPLAAALEHFLAGRIAVGEGYRVQQAPKSAVLYTGTVHVPVPEVIRTLVNMTLPAAARGVVKRPVRILDPSCGAGLFLLAAYRSLAGRGSDPGTILARSLYGTDIDPESVNAARLVLILTYLADNPTGGSTGPEEIRKAAGNLARSVRCGNALIAPDYFSGKQEHPFNAEERRRVNAFRWEDAFPEIVAAGGFDAVIGAPPPYRPFAVRAREEYFQTHYETYAPGAGLYTYFIGRGLSLLRPGGILTFLVPDTFLRAESARPLRRLLLSRRILQLADTGRTRLLQDGEARMFLLMIANAPPGTHFTVVRAGAAGRELEIDQGSLTDGGWTLGDRRAAVLAKRLRAAGTPLERYVMGDIVLCTEWRGAGIVAPEESLLPFFTLARAGAAAPTGPVIVIPRHDPYLAGILNSALARFLIRALCPETDRGYRLSPTCLGKFPVITPDFDTLADKSRHDRLAALVMLRASLADFSMTARTEQDRRLVRQEIDATDVKIDALVYELYGLTEEEIAVVEGS